MVPGSRCVGRGDVDDGSHPRLAYLRLDQALEELDQALDWLLREGVDHGADASRLTAVISSAGGVLAAELLVGTRPLRPSRAALFSPLLAAPADRPGSGSEADGVGQRMLLALRAGEIAAAKSRLLIVRAGGDEPQRLTDLDSAVAALLAADADLTLINAPGAPHAFEVLEDGPRSAAAVQAALDLAAWV